jgi:protein required for attachment to host cells
MLLSHNATVVVADGDAVRLFRNIGREGQVKLEEATAPRLAASAPASGARHQSSAANPDRRTLAEDAHAAAVAAWIKAEVLARRIERLVVVAAPRFLGELRRHYSGEMAGGLVAEVPKEMAGRPVADIEKLLREQR